jgi:nucleolar protein 56
MNTIQDRVLVWVREREPSLLEESRDVEKVVEKIYSGDSEPEYVRKMAELYVKTRECRSIVEKQIGDLMEETAPNVAAVIGPILGARLISKVGSLARLASLPASTIQILGAEKALFRALRKRGKPPKHGIIFQHPWVHASPRKIRGKVARLLASRIAIAARVDCFSGRFIGDELKKDVENRIKSLRGEVG